MNPIPPGTEQTPDALGQPRLDHHDSAYRTLFENHPMPMFVYDAATLRFVAVNRAAVRHYGYSEQEFLSMTMRDIRPEEEVLRAVAWMEAHRHAPTRRAAWKHRTKNGFVIEVVSTSNRVVFDGRDARLVMIEDVTDRKFIEQALTEVEKRFQALVAHSYDSITLLDEKGRRLYASPSIERLHGYTPEELIGRVAFEIIHEDDRQRCLTAFQELLTRPGTSRLIEYRTLHRNGAVHWVEATATNLLEEPAVKAVVVNFRDITERKHSDLALRSSEERLRGIAETAGEWIWEVDLEGVLTYSSAAFERILGYRPDEMIGRSCFELFLPSQRARARQSFERLIEDPSGWNGLTRRLRHRDGNERYLESTAVPMFDADGVLCGFRGVDRDVTERKRFETRIRYQAYHDTLTDLPNRMLFLDRLNVALSRTRRTQTGVAVLFLDLDHFKLINDTLGHSTGDAVLREVARRLQLSVRADDSVARVGGDEFLILLPHVASADGATPVAEKILQNLAEPMSVADQQIYITATIGISLSPSDADEAEDLIKNADAAMYRAKELGRNTIQLFRREMNEAYARRLALETSLRHAIEREEFVVHYQPLYRAIDHTIAGVEALVRWNHPTEGLLQPEDFIDVAEKSRLIVPIGTWVLRRACEDLVRWRAAGAPPLRVAVNLSATQLQQPSIVDTVRVVLTETRLEPSSLELEITESAAMQQAELTLQTLHELKKMGVSIAVDDFGTGYSSLIYLTRFPIDTLKVDRTFVRDVARDDNDAEVVAAVIALAHSLGLKTVGEGVETREQLNFLENHRCSEVQGYLFSRPVSAEEIGKVLRKASSAGANAGTTIV